MAEADAAMFSGAKLALLCDGEILVYRRDDRPDIPFPNCWDLPGGGREGDETPEQCVLRETLEEFGIALPESRLSWSRRYDNWRGDGVATWFFGGAITREEIAAIRFGDEGQHWAMMAIEDYCAAPEGISHLVARVKDFIGRD